MRDAEWIILDTETTGISVPIFVVEVAAQRMRGWVPAGPPFRRLLNQNQDIPPESSRVHGYTREILERDGEPPAVVYAALREYMAGLPLVAYNLDYDLEQVLKPEWRRLGTPALGSAGFCALRLAQRLLDPVPAGNCKLQTLRQYYRLPERGAHTALGDVMTVADLFAQVLRPIAEQRGLDAWETVKAYADEEWYPTRLAFGKHKGKPFHEALRNPELRGWLVWLAASANARSASMGRWYLRELEKPLEPTPEALPVSLETNSIPEQTACGMVIHVHPGVEVLRGLIAASRARLAELEAAYTAEKNHVSALQARIFQRLRPHFEERDRLRLLVRYRRTFLETLLSAGEEEAGRVREAHQDADTRTRQEYQHTAAAMLSKRRLSEDEEAEVKNLWRKLVKLFHPDRYADDPAKQETFTKLTGAINAAKDSGDLETLRQIADDPAGYILRQGWAAIEFEDADELDQLQKLHTSLEAEILAVIEATGIMHESADYELHQIVERDPEVFDRIVQQQVAGVEQEVSTLKTEAERLEVEITELSNEAAPMMA